MRRAAAARVASATRRRNSAHGGSLKATAPSDDLEEIPEINVTPFIDVMLVLLIIFMVAAPLSTVDVAVDLPASNAQPQPRPNEPIFLTVKSDLTLAFGNDPVARERIKSALDGKTQGKTDERRVSARRQAVAYGELMKVMNLLRDAGISEEIALVGIRRGVCRPIPGRCRCRDQIRPSRRHRTASTLPAPASAMIAPAPIPSSGRSKLHTRQALIRWAAASIYIIAAHGGLAYTALNWPHAAVAASEPPAAVIVELAPLPVAPDAPPQDVAVGPKMDMSEATTPSERADEPVEKEEPEPVKPEEPKPEVKTEIERPPLPDTKCARGIVACRTANATNREAEGRNAKASKAHKVRTQKAAGSRETEITGNHSTASRKHAARQHQRRADVGDVRFGVTRDLAQRAHGASQSS